MIVITYTLTVGLPTRHRDTVTSVEITDNTTDDSVGWLMVSRTTCANPKPIIISCSSAKRCYESNYPALVRNLESETFHLSQILVVVTSSVICDSQSRV